MKKPRAAALALVVAFASGPALAEDAEALLKRVAAAMGTADLRTLRYAAEGTGYTFGQADVPSAPWPKITVHSQVRTINYESGSMREDFTLSRGEPKGGGGYPLSGQQKNEWYVSNGYAWNVAGGNPVAGSRFVIERTHQLWVTPPGLVMAALRDKAQARVSDDGGAIVVFSGPGRFASTGYVKRQY